jgi:pimeloyl-ACP methyl ester carboxylesterase
MKTHQVAGGGGLRLHVAEWGRADGPAVLFLHGWSQCLLCWEKQYASALADDFRLVALDLRGHGLSQAPLEAAHYTDPQLWADDTAAAIARLQLDRPVLVGWSYAGGLICDYIRAYGEAGIAGVVFAGATLCRGPEEKYMRFRGPDSLKYGPEACADDLARNIEGIRGFSRACTAKPLPAEELERVLCWSMVVSPRVRAACAGRHIDSDDVLPNIAKPVLVAHGRRDTVVQPAMAEHVLATCPTAEASWYDAAGHMPFWEDPARFNRELADFVRRTRA